MDTYQSKKYSIILRSCCLLHWIKIATITMKCLLFFHNLNFFMFFVEIFESAVLFFFLLEDESHFVYLLNDFINCI